CHHLVRVSFGDKVVGDHFNDWLHEVGRHQLVRCLCHKLQQLGDLLLPWVEVSLQVWVKVEKNQQVDADQPRNKVDQHDLQLEAFVERLELVEEILRQRLRVVQQVNGGKVERLGF